MKFFAAILFLFFHITIYGQLNFDKVFSNNMVLQRDHKIIISGNAKPQSKVTVIKNSIKKTTIASNDSTWTIVFPKEKANSIPTSIIATDGKDSISLKNILIGDVWLCIGQSNMEWPMVKEIHFNEEISKAQNPLLRWYNPTYAGKNTFNVKFSDSILQNLNVSNFYKGSWTQSDSISIYQMSAIGYYFAKRISNDMQIPIGIINLAIGGAPIETFISEDALKSSNHFYHKVDSNWVQNNALPIWVRERAIQNLGIEDKKIVSNQLHGFKPGFAFESGIQPLFKVAIKGVLNYQGESNAQEIERVNEYAALNKLMIKNYRKNWRQPSMPYYFVQISSIDTLRYKSNLWPEFRNEQRKMEKLISNSGIVISSDVGAKNDIHPTNKKIIGERLAKLALNKTYNKNVNYQGPIPISAKYSKNYITIKFKNTYNGLQVSRDSALHGFSIDALKEIPAIISGNIVRIYSTYKPNYVFYAWQPYSLGNLVNTELFPTSTFKIKVK